jgi:hypothetical protein
MDVFICFLMNVYQVEEVIGRGGVITNISYREFDLNAHALKESQYKLQYKIGSGINI